VTRIGENNVKWQKTSVAWQKSATQKTSGHETDFMQNVNVWEVQEAFGEAEMTKRGIANEGTDTYAMVQQTTPCPGDCQKLGHTVRNGHVTPTPTQSELYKKKSTRLKVENKSQGLEN